MTGIHGWKVSWQADLIRRKCCRAKRLRCGTLTDLLRAVAKQKERCAGAPWDTVASHPAHSGFWKVQQEQLQTHLLGFFFFFLAAGASWWARMIAQPALCTVSRQSRVSDCAAAQSSISKISLYFENVCLMVVCWGFVHGVKKKEKKKASTNAGLRFSVCKIPIFKSLICYFRVIVVFFCHL